MIRQCHLSLMFEISQDSTGGVKVNKLLYETFGKTKEEKIEIIRNYKYHSFTEEEIILIMEHLHCDAPRENIVITSGDMHKLVEQKSEPMCNPLSNKTSSCVIKKTPAFIPGFLQFLHFTLVI